MIKVTFYGRKLSGRKQTKLFLKRLLPGSGMGVWTPIIYLYIFSLARLFDDKSAV